MDEIQWGVASHEVVLVGALAAAYGIGVRSELVPRWRLAAFAGGLCLLLVASLPPLHWLATERLLSAHLLQNVVFAEWAPALLVLGLPAGLATRIGTLPLVRTLVHPALALPLWIATYALWHVPAAYDAALRNPAVLLPLEHLSYLVAGMLFWWPVVQAAPRRISSGGKAVYLFAAFVFASPLGLVLSLLTEPAYGFYVDAPDLWGWSDLADQQIAGVTMSVEQAVVLFVLCAVFVRRFLREEEEREKSRERFSQIA